MTIVINGKKFEQFLTILAGSLCLLALVFTVIAIRTSSWTINEYSPDGEVEWSGLFYRCTRLKCASFYNNNFLVIFPIIIGAVFLLISTLSIFLMNSHTFSRRHFYLTPPLCAFIAILLLLFCLSFYGHQSLINGISGRLVITALVLTLTSFVLATYLAGIYAASYQANPQDFKYTKTETDERAERIEEEQQMSTGEN